MFTHSRFLKSCANFSCAYPKAISLVSLTIMVISIGVASKLNFYNAPIENFPDETLEKIDNRIIDDAYAGIVNLEVIIDTGEKQGIFKQAFIEKFKTAASTLENTTIVDMDMANSYSIINILRETHKALNDNQSEFYQLPLDPELQAQELLLFEINDADDLFKVVDQDFSKLRLSLKTKHDNGFKHEKLIREIERTLNNTFKDSASIVITGASVMAAESVPKALTTMANSYLVAAGMIVIVMMIMIKSIRIGLVSMMPNFLPILLVLNFMVLMDWPLDMTTILVGAIAIGIVVDDTLHLLYHFKLNYLISGDASLAVQKTLHSIGPALMITTCIFSLSIGCNMLSSLDNIFVFGLTLFLVTVLAFLVDIIVTPALLIWIYTKDSKSVADKL